MITRLVAILFLSAVLVGCSDPSAPENAPPEYPDMTDPSQIMGGQQGTEELEGAD